jgi:hypothetical protein
MRYFLVLFFSVVFLGSFLVAKQARATDCNDICTMPSIINGVLNLDWNACATKCKNEGGFFPPPPSGEENGSKNTVSPTSDANFKNIGTKLGNVKSGFYGDVAPKSLEQMIGGYIKTGLALVGVIFLLLMVYGGYIWMIARGDDTEATKAKDTITMATIGLAVVLIAYVITYFVLSYALQSVGQ